MKTLDQISWQVSEQEYRADTALSYSTLAKYEREGFNNLNTLFAHVESPSLLLGSLVDCMITSSQEEFDALYFVADFPTIGEKEKSVAKSLFSTNWVNFNAIPYNDVLEAANQIEFQKNWRDDTRVKVLRERCSKYYELLGFANGRTVVDRKTFEDAHCMVIALRSSRATSYYFADNKPNSPVQRYYQLKFKFFNENVEYRNMADLLVCDYDKKRIIPVDLKTSSHTEWDFQDSFLQWNYMIQARLYWRSIRYNLDKDHYFKDFLLDDYHFIVVNKKTLTPLVWSFPYTKYEGTLIDKKGNVYRDPFVIGKELQNYLQNKPKVPVGIDLYKANTITALQPLDNDN